jgi:hypothetical protein
MFLGAWEDSSFYNVYKAQHEHHSKRLDAPQDQVRQYAFGVAMTAYQLERLGYNPDSQTQFISDHAESFLESCKTKGEQVAIQDLLTTLSKIQPQAAQQEPPVPGPKPRPDQMPPEGVALHREESEGGVSPNPTLLPKGFPLERLQDAAFEQTFMHAFDRDLHRTRLGLEHWNDQQIAQFSFVYAVYISQGIPENDAGSQAHKFVNDFAHLPQERQAAFISERLSPETQMSPEVLPLAPEPVRRQPPEEASPISMLEGEEEVPSPQEQQMRAISPGVEHGEDLGEGPGAATIARKDQIGGRVEQISEDEDMPEEVAEREGAPPPQEQLVEAGVPLPPEQQVVVGPASVVKEGGGNLWIDLYSELPDDFPIPSDNPNFVDAFRIGVEYINKQAGPLDRQSKMAFAYAFAISVTSNSATSETFNAYISSGKKGSYDPPFEAVLDAFMFRESIEDAGEDQDRRNKVMGQLWGGTLTRSQPLPPPENLNLPQDFTGPWENRDFLKFYLQGLTDVSVEGETPERKKAYAYAYAIYAWNEPGLPPDQAVFSPQASKAARTFMEKIGSAREGERKKLVSELLTRESTEVETTEVETIEPQPQTPAKPGTQTREKGATPTMPPAPEALDLPKTGPAQRGISLPVGNAVAPPAELGLPPDFMAPWDGPFKEAFQEGLEDPLTSMLHTMVEKNAFAFAYAAYKTTNTSTELDASASAYLAASTIAQAEQGKRGALIAGLFKPQSKVPPPPQQVSEQQSEPISEA